MFVAQLAASMLVWATVVILLARRRESLLRRAVTMLRVRRVWEAVGALLGSIALLVLGMGALALGGMVPGRLTWWGWPTLTLAGAGFIALQTVGLVPLMLNAVTGRGARPSDKEDSPHL